MPKRTPTLETTAEAYLALLKSRGIDWLFANAGTDFAPIIEALSRRSGGVKYPRFVTVPHENLAMSMAYGYYRATGKIAMAIAQNGPGVTGFLSVAASRVTACCINVSASSCLPSARAIQALTSAT